MAQFEFGPGEEKLAKAFELIQTLQRMLVAQAQRQEVDEFVIAALLSATSDREAVQSTWAAMVRDYYPQQALGHLGQELRAEANQMLKDRIDMWSKVIGRSPDPHE